MISQSIVHVVSQMIYSRVRFNLILIKMFPHHLHALSNAYFEIYMKILLTFVRTGQRQFEKETRKRLILFRHWVTVTHKKQ